MDFLGRYWYVLVDHPCGILMSKPGRNDPCPCGSGKKYKRCHGAADFPDPEMIYDRIRRLDNESDTLLLRYAKEQYGDDVLEQAWEDFVLDEELLFDPDDPEFRYFALWACYDWKPAEDNTRLPEQVLGDPHVKIEDDIRRFVGLVMAAPYSYYQVLDVEPGHSIRLRDILRKQEVSVTERGASTTLEKGNIIFARVLEMEEVTFLMGLGGHVILPHYLEGLIKFRASLERHQLLTGGPSDAAALLEIEEDLRETYFEIIRSEEHDRPDFRNTDGEPLALYALHYEISSFERAFAALKSLDADAQSKEERAVAHEGGKDELETPVKARIDWMKKSRKAGGLDTVTLAHFSIGDRMLVVNVNSEERSRLVQKEIARRLGEDAVLIRTDVLSHEELMKRTAERSGKARGTEKRESEHDRIMRKHPEVQAYLKEQMDRHWASWPDTPVPALKGMTPRQAADDPVGRELLESLLLDFESRNARLSDDFNRVDIAKLRSTLGLDVEESTGRKDPGTHRIAGSETPTADFSGLSHAQVQRLLNGVDEGSSPLKIRPAIDDDTLNALPFFRLTEEFLKIIQQQRALKLTTTGALPVKIVQELYAHKLIVEDIVEAGYSSVRREADSTALQVMHLVARLSGAIRKEHNKLSMTRKGEKLLRPTERLQLFREIFSAFTRKFSWSYNDRYADSEIGQFCWGFSVYLLAKFGDTPRPTEFYADKYRAAFPGLFHRLPAYPFSTPEKDFSRCYSVRTFDRFLEWFGLVKVAQSDLLADKRQDPVTRTEVFSKVFDIGL